MMAVMIVTRNPIFTNTLYIEINWMGKIGRKKRLFLYVTNTILSK
jgi:hypothetical protein